MNEKFSRKSKQFWIDTTGACHKFEENDEDVVSLHYRIAKSIYPNSEDPEAALLKLGWVMVGSSVYNCPLVHKKPTQAQINKLYALEVYNLLCFLHKNSYINYEKYSILCE